MTSARKRREGPRPSRLSGLSGFLTRRPRLALASWVLLVAVLAFMGRDLAGQLEAHPLYIKGTEATQARDISLQQFGSDESMVVALRGPRAAVAGQGEELAARLNEMPKTLVVSPWSAGAAIGGLRPEPDVAGIVVRVGHRSDEALTEMLELVEGQVEKTVRPPVQASIAGLPKIFDSYADANESASKTGETIAIPVLLIILLLVFRSVVAALIPVVVGGVVVAATEGVMKLLLGTVEIDAFALGAAGMMGLALGVDYSLLVVSRFREERRKTDLADAVRTTVEKTARSIVPAGCGLVLAMLIAAQVLPGAVVTSSALAIVIATVLSGFSALFAVPAMIMLLGSNLERWSLPQGRFSTRGAPLWLSTRISRRPGLVVAIAVGLAVLGSLSFTLDTGVATPGLLPKGAEGRVEEERVERALGPGWLAPIEVVVSGRGEPMASPQRMRSLVALQDRLQHEQGVETVTGFSAVERSLEPLSSFESQLTELQRGTRKLGDGLARTDDGAEQNSSGLREAAAGAGLLTEGAEDAEEGAGRLGDGLAATDTGSARLAGALDRASKGSDRLADNTSEAQSGAGRLVEALEKGQEGVEETEGDVNSMKSSMEAGSAELTHAQGPLRVSEERLASAWQALSQMTTGATDPQYEAVQRALREARENLSGTSIEGEAAATTEAGVQADIVRAQRQFELGLYLAGNIGSNNDKAGAGAEKLAKEARRLEEGIEDLAGGASKVAGGIEDLSAEGDKLSPALQRLQKGTEDLTQGLGRLAGGAVALHSGLGGGVSGADRLAIAVDELRAGLESADPEGLRQLRERSPELFRSGYFYLAALDGSNPSRRDLANFLIDLESGGHTARMMVIPRHPITTSQGEETLNRVRDDAQAFARSTGTLAVVGGLSASQLSINDTLREQTEVARLAMMLVTLLILIPVLRSVTVPLIAAFLNLLTVFASLGVIALLFNDALLGGPGYVDAANVPATTMVIFGLAIDYEVFIFARMREEYARTGSTTQAVDNGLARTAPVVTGAAVIMITVFLCFSVSEFITLRNFGVAQATAVFIDAFIIRLIIVPALMKGLGKWSWWMPRWLDRLLPGESLRPERPSPS